MESKHWLQALFVVVSSYCLHSASAASKTFIEEKVDMLAAAFKKDINDLRVNLARIINTLQSNIANVKSDTESLLRKVEEIQSKLGEGERETTDEPTNTTDFSENENQSGNQGTLSHDM